MRWEVRGWLKTRDVSSEACLDGSMHYIPRSSQNASGCISAKQGWCGVSPPAGPRLGWWSTRPQLKVAYAFAARVSFCCWVQTDPGRITLFLTRAWLSPYCWVPQFLCLNLNFCVSHICECWGLPGFPTFWGAEVNIAQSLRVSQVRTNRTQSGDKQAQRASRHALRGTDS